MNLGPLEEFVHDFDEAVKVCVPHLGSQFTNYPRGSCGAASEILAECLAVQGFGRFAYVSGLDRDQSHAWLEKDGLIVDVTSGQFEDSPENITISRKSIWHKKFYDLVVVPDGSFRSWGDQAVESAVSYQIISAELRSLRDSKNVS